MHCPKMKKTTMSTLTTSIQHCARGSSQSNKEKKNPDRKEEAKLYFVNNMILLIESLNKSTKKLLVYPHIFPSSATDKAQKQQYSGKMSTSGTQILVSYIILQ